MKLQSGNIQNYVAESEHAIVNGIEAKKVVNVDIFGNIDGGNPSQVLGYTGANLTTITKTVNGVQYQQTLSYDEANNLVGISAWVKL